jgi:hypothetical protein
MLRDFMPQTVTAPTQDDELDRFVQSFKTAAPKSASSDDDDLDSFVKQFKSASPQQQSGGSKIATPDVVAARAKKDGTSTGKAVENLRAEGYTTAPFPKTDPRSHDFGWSQDASGNWTQDPAVAARDAAPAPQSTIPIVPFSGIVQTQPLDQRASKLGAPIVQLTPPPTDTGKIPINLFTRGAQAPGTATVEDMQREGSLAPDSQTVTGRVARAIGAGTPEGSVLANLTGQIGTKGDIGPRVQDLMTESEQQRHPVLTGAGEFASGLLSPEGVMLLAGTAGAGELAGPVGQTVRQLMAVGFTAQMVSDAASTVPDISAAIQRGDTYTAQRLMTRAALSASLGGLAGRGMFEGEAPTQAGYSPVAESETLANRKSARMVGPKNEPLTPESDATLKAQVDALGRGSNPIVYFPAGHETLPAPPENAQVTAVPGDQAGAGVYYHDDSVTPDQIHQSVADGTFGQLLGNVQSKHEAILGGKPAAVIARGADGAEVKASLVDAGNPQAIAKQAATLARQFPDAEIGLEHPDKVVSERQAGSNATRVQSGDTDELDQFVEDYRAANGKANAQIGVELPETVTHPVTGEPVKITPDELDAGANSLYGQSYADLAPIDKAKVIHALTPRTTGESVAGGTPEKKVAGSHEVVRDEARTPAQLPAPRQSAPDEITTAYPVRPEKLSKPVPGEVPLFKGRVDIGPDSKLVTIPEDEFQRQLNEKYPSVGAGEERSRAASRETPQVREGDEDDIDGFVARHSEARGVLQPQAHELNTLGSQVKHIDPHVADALNGLADGRYFSREDLLKIASGIRDAKTSADLRSIVNEFSDREDTSRTTPAQAAKTENAPSSENSHASGGPPQFVSEDAEQVRGQSEGLRQGKAENRNQLTPEVGDVVQVHAGALKGSKLEVTKVGQTGVYVKGEGGPIKFVRNGDFAVSRELTSGHTFFANPIGTALSEGSRILSRAWEQKVARPLIDRVLKIGDKYQDIRQADPAIAESLHLLDNAPTYLREKATQHVKDIVGSLSRPQERLFTLLADSDSRENLKANHPTEFRQAENDPAIQQALRRYKPVEQELTAARERLGGQTLDQDYLRRVYDQHIAGVNRREAVGPTGESTPSDFDRVIRPQQVNTKRRKASAEYHYQNGLHEFGPAFGTKFIATHLKLLRDEVANDFMSKATQVAHGSSEPASITYEGQRYYRPDLAREAQESGRKDVKQYGVYNPTEGERFPVPSEAKFLGPKSVVDTLRNYGGKDAGSPGALHRFFQEQILGFGFGVPHVFNILRRVTQSTAGGAANPVAWVRALKVGLSKSLRDRGISGLDDPTFDMLAQHGAISTREVSNLKSYIGGNLNPANWMRGIAQVGHKALFDPKSFGGFGGVDQRARLYVADLIRSQRPDLSDSEIARGVNDALGEYGRANWTDRQKMLGRFMMFPGWDFSSLRWVLQNPLKTTVPPAILTLLANRALHSIGQNHGEDQNDISAVHIGDRAYSTGLLRESMARNLFRPAINYAQAKLAGKSNIAALDEAGRGVTQGAGGLLNTLRPDLSGFVALATNRENIASGKEIVSKGDYDTPGKILPSRALEKQAAFAVRHAFPALDRVLDQKGDVDLRSFVGGNLGVPNYRQSAEDRLKRNAAEAQRVMATVTKLSKSDPAAAKSFLKDPDNAALALFHNDVASLSENLKRIDKAKAQVEGSKLSDSVKAHRLQALDRARQNVLAHADALDQRLFDRRTSSRRQDGKVPFAPPGTY